MHLTKKITPELALYYCIAALFCVTPLSSSLKSIFLSATVAIIVMTPGYRQELINLIKNKFFITGLSLVLLALIGCIWSPASNAEKLLIVEKWSKLLYLPCLVIALNNPKHRFMASNAFLIAMVFTCGCSFFLKFTDLTLTGKVHVDGVFRNHIMTSIMTAFAAYLAGNLFINLSAILEGVGASSSEARCRNMKYQRALYLITLIITSSHILIINESRTGYVIYLLLMMLLILQNTNKHKALIGIAIVCGIFAGSCYLNPELWSRVKLVETELKEYQTDKNTSIGYRLQFHKFAEELFKAHPLIGNGTGSFTYKFRTENPVPAWQAADFHSGRLLEPHGQYWLIAAEFGSFGLFVFLLFYLEILYRIFKLDSMRPIGLAIFIIFATGNLTDSLLFYSGSGYFFILFLALAFSEKISVKSVDPQKLSLKFNSLIL